MFIWHKTPISGCHEIVGTPFTDARGRFVKVFEQGAFAANDLRTDFVETYYSVSFHKVIRGLHFQRPPMQHAKLVTCIVGRAFDVVVDLRRGSPTYGQHAHFDLDAEKPTAIYVPAGLAHGFCSLCDSSVLLYHVTSPHSPQHDDGIHWNSVGVRWPTTEPVVSERDASFVSFDEFSTPFIFEDRVPQ